MNNARIKLPYILKGKNKKQIKEWIEENIYNKDYKDIATKYYVYEQCQVDIAMEYNVDRRTISRMLDRIMR